ncbi:MAG: MATE family efflux transporter [Gammaproteobacteria bacterium]|nr:MATE family efflux transporter [Gammaproteobacteria bacterium]NNM14728.1 MATE family efflux transporter [Gammaproteobacteria bacterium]
MKSFKTLFNKEHAGSILSIGWPLIINNLAIMSMNLADTIMSGQHSTDTLAAVAAGGAVWTILFLTGMGIIMALSPITAQYFGKNEFTKAGHYLRQTLWLAVMVSIPLAIAGQYCETVFEAFKLEPEIVELADGYLSAIVYGLPLSYVYMSFRMSSEGIGHTRPVMYISLLAAVLNVFLNWALIYGHFGFPELGAVGCGIASAITLSLMAIVMLWYVSGHYRYKPLKIFSHFEWPSASSIYEILKLGFPIGVSIVAEVGLFSCAALLMGSLGKNIIAAHQVAINYAAFMFMVPFAMSMANTSVVGQLLGQGKVREARTAGHTGMVLATGFMTVSALIMIVFATQIIGFYTDDPAVAKVAIGLLGMAAAFQIVDGIQVAASGALRGFKDTQIPMYMNLFSYWAIGFVVAWYLGIHKSMGPNMVWFGLVIGLAVAAVLLTWRFEVVSRRAIPAPVPETISGSAV